MIATQAVGGALGATIHGDAAAKAGFANRLADRRLDRQAGPCCAIGDELDAPEEASSTAKASELGSHDEHTDRMSPTFGWSPSC